MELPGNFRYRYLVKTTRGTCPIIPRNLHEFDVSSVSVNVGVQARHLYQMRKLTTTGAACEREYWSEARAWLPRKRTRQRLLPSLGTSTAHKESIGVSRASNVPANSTSANTQRLPSSSTNPCRRPDHQIEEFQQIDWATGGSKSRKPGARYRYL